MGSDSVTETLNFENFESFESFHHPSEEGQEPGPQAVSRRPSSPGQLPWPRSVPGAGSGVSLPGRRWRRQCLGLSRNRACPRPDPEGWGAGRGGRGSRAPCPRGGASTWEPGPGTARTSALRGEGGPPAGPAGGEGRAGWPGARGWRRPAPGQAERRARLAEKARPEPLR